jgi:hypothetical protein
MAIYTAFTSGHASLPVYTSKISTDTWFPILLVDKTDGITGETGIAYGNVDVDFGLASATSLTAYSPASADWKELGEGMYALRIGASEFGSVGRYFIRLGDDTPNAGKCVFVVETFAVTKDDLVRGTTPANTLDIDSNGLVDVSKFNGTAAVVDGTTNLLRVDVGGISSDATAANTLEAIVEGSTLLSVNTTKISGDTTAADNLELFTETLSSGALAAGSFASNCITAAKIASDAITSSQLAATVSTEIADGVWDEATSGHTTSGTFGEQLKTDVDAILADTGTDGVKIDLAQSMSAENFSVLTVGRALYLTIGHFDHKWKTDADNKSRIYKSDGSVFSARTITTTGEIQKAD